MRTTLDIDDDLLFAAKEMARHENSSAGQVVSRLLRDALTGRVGAANIDGTRPVFAVLGFEPFSPRPGAVTTNDEVNKLREQEGI